MTPKLKLLIAHSSVSGLLEFVSLHPGHASWAVVHYSRWLGWLKSDILSVWNVMVAPSFPFRIWQATKSIIWSKILLVVKLVDKLLRVDVPLFFMHCSLNMQWLFWNVSLPFLCVIYNWVTLGVVWGSEQLSGAPQPRIILWQITEVN